MKAKWILVGLVLLGASVLVFSAIRALAQRPEPPVKEPAQDSSLVDYLLMLPMPDYSKLDIQPGWQREQSAQQAWNWIRANAKPVLDDLKQKQRLGEIAGFELRPELNAVAVQLPRLKADRVLKAVPQVHEIVSSDASGKTCGVNNARLIEQQFAELSAQRAFPAITAATDPSVLAYLSTGWSFVRGRTSANIAVSMTILRNGATIGTGTTTSDNLGYYSFYPTYLGGCAGSNYSWVLKPGDVVQVTAHGTQVSITVATLTAWANPFTNVVGGVTAPGQSLNITVLNPPASDYCLMLLYSKLATAAPNGSFQVDFTSTVDLLSMAYAQLLAQDANGNGTIIDVKAFSINTNMPESTFWGTLLPATNYEFVQMRLGSPVYTTTGTTDARGYFSGDLQFPQEGDQIQASGGGISVSTTVARFEASLNLVDNSASGTTAGSSKIQINFQKPTLSYWNGIFSTTCGAGDDCITVTSDITGEFTADSSLDLVRGDRANVLIYDAAGNYQYQILVPSTIVVAPADWNVWGFWQNPWDELMVVLINSSNEPEIHNAWASSDGMYNSYFNNDILPGDRIEVGNGVITETMTVQTVTAELDSQTDHLTGSAPNGHLLAFVEPSTYGASSGATACKEVNFTGTNYDFNFTTQGISAAHEADVYSTDADGHYTMAYSHAFYTYTSYTDTWVEGYVPTPNTTVTVEWSTSGGEVIDIQYPVSFLDGWFYAALYNPSYASMSAGQHVKFTSGSYALDITLPALTINKDGAQNRLYGSAPANLPVKVAIEKWGLCYKGSSSQCGYGLDSDSAANASGSYSVSFAGLLYDDCSPVMVGAACSQGHVISTRADEHVLSTWTPALESVSKDSFEYDDVVSSAVLYKGTSYHTFDVASDVDWVKFVVSPEQVNQPLTLQTFALGPFADTVLTLYDTDGETQLAWNDDAGPDGSNSIILWSPPSAGTFYMKIEPYSENNAGNCGTFYSFGITRFTIYIPLADR